MKSRIIVMGLARKISQPPLEMTSARRKFVSIMSPSASASISGASGTPHWRRM